MNNSQKSRSDGSQKVRANDMTEEQFDAAVINVTAFLLSDMRNKRKIRKEDVVANALNKSGRQYGSIMKRVADNLSNIFGLQLKKIPNNEDAFIIVNKHKQRFYELTQEFTSVTSIQDELLLTNVLASIFMNRGQMFESHLLTLLETIGFLSNKFYGSSCEHKMKEHVTKLINNVFVKQMYLEAQSIDRPEQAQNPPLPENEKKVILLHWGFRAYLEMDVEKIVGYITKIHDGKKPPAFPLGHYKELKAKQEELRAQIL